MVTFPPIGIEAWVYSILAAALLVMYIYLLAPIVRRTFQENHPNRWSNLVVLIVWGIIAVLYLLPFASWGFYLAYPASYWVLNFITAWSLITLIGWRTMKPSSERVHNATLQQGLDTCNKGNLDTINFSYSGEVRRKTLHILALLMLFAFSIGYMVFRLVSELYGTMAALNTPEQLASIEWAYNQDHYFQGLMCYNIGGFGASCVEANCEILRLRYPKVNFALKRTLQKTRRASEARSFGAHVSMLPGFLLGGIILTYDVSTNLEVQVMAIFALVTVSTLADLMAAMIGRRYGKHKWKRFHGKSIEGTLAGSITAFIGSVFFVGPVLGLLSVGIFIITDLVLGELRISDNLTTPLLLAIVYRLFIFLANPIISDFWYLKW